jgi:hypothetical protein
MAIRSGRFKGSAAGTGIVVISGRSGRFRIYNAGATPFTVHPTSGSGTTKDITVSEDCSVDVEINNECSITATGDVDGIYDYIGSSRKVRSGRFKGSAAAPVKIVQDASKAFYRILNSGTADVAVSVATDGLNPTMLKATFSLDVSTGQDITVAGADIECIYEQLRVEQDTRSGRFRFTLPLPSPNPFPHKIIDLKGGGQRAWYRLFNSGPTPILIQEGNSSGAGSLVGVVAPQDSLDFEADNKDIYVRPDDDNDGAIDAAADNTQPIEGSFDFIAPA